jgi:hypothetical protein
LQVFHGIFNTIHPSHDLSQEDCQVLESALTAAEIPRPIPLHSIGVDAALSNLFQSLKHVERELPEPLDSLARHSQEILQTGFKSAPTLQLVLEELNPHQ